MYRLLIVDDEPIIVEGLYDLFVSCEELQLEVYRAYDAEEALKLSRTTRMDILLTDIQMPGMSGLELQQEFNRHWPRCKVIFLTGYNEFDYIQSSIRGGAMDYVLKTEGDELIQEAVMKAVCRLEKELSLDQLIMEAKSRWSAAIPSMRREYLSEIMRGETGTRESRRSRFRELDIGLCEDGGLYMVVCRVDHWREEMSPGDKSLFLFSITNIVEEFLTPSCAAECVFPASDQLVWFIQGRPDPQHRDETALSSERFLLGTMESVQHACRTYLKLPCSFVVGETTCTWEQVPEKYDRLRLLFMKGSGTGGELLLSDRHPLGTERTRNGTAVRKIQQLEGCLERMERDRFFTIFHDIVRSVDDGESLYTGMALEIFTSFSALFISHLNRSGLLQEMSEKISLTRLLSICEHESWAAAVAFLEDVASRLFDRDMSDQEQQTNELVRRIHEYAEAHIGGDLSLSVLSEEVYLTPSYLSRLYKQKTGFSLTDFIADLRLKKAKELLVTTRMRIQDIACMAGFESTPYFNRFFKKATHMTPQEYRDSAT